MILRRTFSFRSSEQHRLFARTNIELFCILFLHFCFVYIGLEYFLMVYIQIVVSSCCCCGGGGGEGTVSAFVAALFTSVAATGIGGACPAESVAA